MKIRDLISDEDFNGLPEIEKAKVVETLAKGDNEFQALPEEEKIKVLATVTGGSYQLASQKGKVQTPQPVVEKEQSFTNLLRQGLPEQFSMFGGIGAAFGEAAGQQFKGMEALGIPTPKAKPEVGKAFTEGAEKGTKFGYELTGAYKTKPPTEISGQVYENAVKALGDPLSWVGGGIKSILGNVIGSSLVSGTATVTGELGAQTEKSLTGGDTGVGRVIGAFGAVPTQAATQALFSKGVVAPAQNIYQKYKGATKDSVELEKSLSTGAAKRILERAAKEQGITDIDAFVNDFNAIGQKINKQNVPLFVALSDNPTIRSHFVANYRTDPDFRAMVNKQLETLAFDIDKNADKVFGARFSPVPADSGVKIANVKKRISDIDNRIEDLSFRVTPSVSQENLGTAVENLVEAKKRLVQSEISPQYSALIKEATKADVKLPAASTQAIYSFVRQNNLRDIFGKGTPLDSKIMSVLYPKKKEVIKDVQQFDSLGMPKTSKQKQIEDAFPELSFENLDSLKRNINSIQRQKLSPEQARKINQLEDVVNNARQNLPGNYNQRLLDIDRQYYERLGVPFNTANINDIDSKKYAEQIAPVIIQNGSGLKQFLNAVGDEGLPIARNAVMADVYKKVVKDGKINLSALAKYSKDKAEVINQIPGMKEELQTIALDQNKLFLAKANLDKAYKVQETKLAQSFLVQQGQNVDFTALTNKITTDRGYLNKILNTDLKQVSPETRKAVVNNLRRELVDKAYSSGQGLKFFTEPRNQYMIDRVFGKGYANQVKQVAKLSDKAKALDVEKIPSVVSQYDKDALGAYLKEMGLPGLDLAYVSSNFRDRITSNTQKVIRLLSRVNTERVNMATKEQIQELLLDPDGLAKFNKVASNVNFNLENPFSLQAIMASFAERVPLYAYQAGKTLDDSEEETQQQLPEDFVGGEFY